MALLPERELRNAKAALHGVGIGAEIQDSGGGVQVLRVERTTDEAFVLVTCESVVDNSDLYVVGYYRNEEADGETICNYVDIHGLIWIVAAFRRGVVA